MIDFSNSIFETDYSFGSARSIIRALSDSFSKQYCDTRGAIKYGAKQTDGRCIYCGKPMYKLSSGNIPSFSNTIHYDHIYPASKLNLFEVGNVAIACSTCNLAKSDRLPMDYYDMRLAEGLSLLFYERDVFEDFLNKFTEPYRDKWPDHYAAGSRNVDDDDEFKILLTELLFNKVSIASVSSKYSHESSINADIWKRVVEKAYEDYSPLTAKDVEGRIGYTNLVFEDTLGHDVSIKDVSIQQLKFFIETLLLSKYESKNEICKYRMLIKLLTETLNEDLMKGQLSEFYKEVPTYAKMSKDKN